MAHSYEASKKIALSTIILLGIITVVEVMIALTGKGYIVEGWKWPWWLMGILMISLSAYKAYKIVFEFMHMKYEVRALAFSVLLPTLLLVWGIIAFLFEGQAWKGNREVIKEKDKIESEESVKPESLLHQPDTKRING